MWRARLRNVPGSPFIQVRVGGIVPSMGPTIRRFDPLGDEDPGLVMAIAPVVIQKDGATKCLGTAFCIAAQSGKALYVTAQHVVAEFLPSGLPVGAYQAPPLGGWRPYVLLPKDNPRRLVTAKIEAVALCLNRNDIAVCTVDLSDADIAPEQATALQATMRRPQEGEKCVAFGYGGMEANENRFSGPLEASLATVVEVYPVNRGGHVDFPSFRTDAYYPFGMSGGPIIGESDNRVMGVVSEGFNEGTRVAYGAIFAAVLAAEVDLPDEEGVLHVRSFQDLSDHGLVDVTGPDVKVNRTDDASSLEWPDEAG
jgi:hypothetical protein